jgi:hypothetical protein
MGYTPDYAVRSQIVTKIRDQFINNIRRILSTDPKYTYVELPNGDYDFVNTKVIISDIFPQDHIFYPAIIIENISGAEDRYLGPESEYIPRSLPPQAQDATTSTNFDVLSIIDTTHLGVSSLTGLNVGDTISQGTNTTTITFIGLPITITSIPDSTHIVVSSVAGISNGDTIVQGVHTTVVQAVGTSIGPNYIQVVSSSGFVLGTAYDISVPQITVGSTSGWAVSTTSLSGNEVLFASITSSTVTINIYTIDDSIQRDELTDLIYNNLKYTTTDLANFGIEIIKTHFPTFASAYSEGRWFFSGKLSIDVYSEWNGVVANAPNITDNNVSISLSE